MAMQSLVDALHTIATAINATLVAVLTTVGNTIHRLLAGGREHNQQQLKETASEVLGDLQRTGQFDDRLICLIGGLACWQYDPTIPTEGIDFAVELEPTGSVGGLTSALLALGGSAFRRTGSFLVYDSPSSGQSIAIASMTQPKCASPPPLSVLGTISETDSRQDGPVPYLPGASIKVGSYRDGLPCPSERDLFLLEMYACGRARTARQRRKHARDAMKLLESITEPTVSAFNINEYDKQLIGGSVQLAAALTGRNEAWWEARLQVPR